MMHVCAWVRIPVSPGKNLSKMISQIRSNLNSAHLDIIYNSKLRLVHKYKMHHHGMVIRCCRPNPNYFVGTAGRRLERPPRNTIRNTIRLATQRYDACMCMGSNPGEPGKKIVKNDFTNQVKFELSTFRHYL